MLPGNRLSLSVISVVLLASLNACARSAPVVAAPAPTTPCPAGSAACAKQPATTSEIPTTKPKTAGNDADDPNNQDKEDVTAEDAARGDLPSYLWSLGEAKGVKRLVESYERPIYPDQPPQHSSRYNAMKTFVEGFLRKANKREERIAQIKRVKTAIDKYFSQSETVASEWKNGFAPAASASGGGFGLAEAAPVMKQAITSTGRVVVIHKPDRCGRLPPRR